MPKKIMVCLIYSAKPGQENRSDIVEISALKDIVPPALRKKAGPAASAIIISGVNTVTLSPNHRVDVMSSEEIP